VTASAVTTDELVRRARAGDEVAFEALYRAHVGRVYAVCLRMAGNAAEAKALTQDAFVRAWEKLGEFRGEAAFGTWLHRLAVNVVLLDRRQAARRREDALPDEDAAPPARTDAPLELRMDLEAAVGALPTMARQVLVLYDVEGYRHAEIGVLLGIAEGTSKAHLFRARRLLREALER
jgi:RNA polymerase sigma-70 factor, ECF subfamily